jgi:biotin carboxyl carrier protein
VSRDRDSAGGPSATFDVVVNGRPWRVVLEREGTGSRYVVGVKGRRRSFDVAWLDETTISLIDQSASSSRVSEAGIIVKSRGDLTIVIDGEPFAVSVAAQGGPPHPQSGTQRAPDGNGPLSVVAPMPGRVVRLLVSTGDRLTAGQGVVVVEAMKMENELRSNKDGVVREVRCRPGDAVEAGAVLVVIE